MAEKKKMKTFDIMMSAEEVIYTNISTSADGYNYARMVAKRGDKEHLIVNYEWEGASIPNFAMDMMMFMKDNNVETSGVWEGKEAEYSEYSAKKKEKKKKGMCPDCKKPLFLCECDKSKDEEKEEK